MLSLCVVLSYGIPEGGEDGAPFLLNATQVTHDLLSRNGLRTAACEDLSTFALRHTLKVLMSVRDTKLVEAYSEKHGQRSVYASESAMKAHWAKLPLVKTEDSEDSRIVKHAHCYSAVTMFLLHLSPSDQTAFSSEHFLPLLPSQANPSDRLNQYLLSEPDLKTIPCHRLSVFSLRTTLSALLQVRDSDAATAWAREHGQPFYASEAALREHWATLPTVQAGENEGSRRLKSLHCYEAAEWFVNHLTKSSQLAFAKSGFMPLVPMEQYALEVPSKKLFV